MLLMQPLDGARIRDICARYEQGQTAISIGQAVGVTRDTVRRYLRKQGVRLRTPHEYRKHVTIDESKFSVIEDELSAYWLGFMAADGSVAGEYRVVLALQERDRDHVIAFRDWLGTNASVIDYTASGPYSCRASRVCVYSKVIAQNLEQYGVVRRKSLVLQPPTFLRNDLVRHWIRGFIDGDGGFYIRRNAKGYAVHSMKVTSTEDVISWIAYVFAITLGTNPKVALDRRSHTSVVSLSYSGRKTVGKIGRFLYEHSTVSLKRKADIARAIYSELTPTLG